MHRYRFGYTAPGTSWERFERMLAAAEHPVQPHIRPGLDRSVPRRRYTDPYLRVFDLSSGSSLQREPSGSRRLRCAGLLAPHGVDEEGTLPTPQRAFRPAGLSQNQHPRWPHRQEYRERPAGGIPECSRGGAVCCRIQLGMIPLGLNFMATISIFAHWPLALRAEATT